MLFVSLLIVELKTEKPMKIVLVCNGMFYDFARQILFPVLSYFAPTGFKFSLIRFMKIKYFYNRTLFKI